MASNKVRLDRAGIAEVLVSDDVRVGIDTAAHSVASYIDETVSSGEALPVKIDAYTSDRAAAGVTLAHAAGLGKQAKHGTLTRAASAAGLEVTAR